MNEQFFDHLVILSMYVIALVAAFCVAETIVVLVMELYESRLKYGNAKVGHVLKPSAKKCKFTTTMRASLAKLRFN